MTNSLDTSGGRGGRRIAVACAGFLAIALFLLVTEHGAHAIGYLPLILLALCPFLHLFMHRGHCRHGGTRTAHPAIGAGGPQAGQADGRPPPEKEAGRRDA